MLKSSVFLSHQERHGICRLGIGGEKALYDNVGQSHINCGTKNGRRAEKLQRPLITRDDEWYRD